MRRFVYLLMSQPVTDLNVTGAFNLIPHYAVLALEFAQPAVNELFRVVVVGEEKAREHSRIPAKPPGVVGNRPKLNECQPRIARDATHAFAVWELWLDTADARHLFSAQSRDFPLSPVYSQVSRF